MHAGQAVLPAEEVYCGAVLPAEEVYCGAVGLCCLLKRCTAGLCGAVLPAEEVYCGAYRLACVSLVAVEGWSGKGWIQLIPNSEASATASGCRSCAQADDSRADHKE
jgi:hypothetical protein